MPLAGGGVRNEATEEEEEMVLDLDLQLSWDEESQNLWPNVVVIHIYEFSTNG